MSELEVSKKLVIFEEHEKSLYPHYLGSRRMKHSSDLSHAHPDMPLPSTEASSNYIPSAPPIERHVRRRSAISQDLQEVKFPKDEAGFIAQVPDVVLGRDISPYAAHIRSRRSPVSYKSHDYGPRAASTPSEGAGEEPGIFQESVGAGDDRPDSGQKYAEHFGELNEPGNDLPGMKEEEKDGHEVLHELTHDVSKKNEEQAFSNPRTLPIHSFVDSNRIAWDLENSGSRRMLGRRPPPLLPPSSECASSLPEMLPHCQSKVRKQDHSQNFPSKCTSVGSSTMLRGGLLETIDDTIVELPPTVTRHLHRDLPRLIPPLIANFNNLCTFISSRGNEYFCEIDEDYLTDRFNLTGLNTDVQYYQYALDLVTDVFDLDCDDDMREQIEKSARHLYGLVHARYITTTRGLAKMLEKYKKCDFGKCPRVMCQNHPLLPTGMADLPHVQSVKLYCGKCEDIYNPKSSRHSTIDGAYFGTSFQNILFQVYPALIPEKSVKRYEPRIFGFKVHAAATLERWQAKKREEMQERLREVGVEKVFKEDVADSGEEMEEDDAEEGDGFVE